MKRALLTLLLSLFPLLNASSQEQKWYGIFTVNDLPRSLEKVTGCKIVSMGTYLYFEERFITPDRAKPLSECGDACYLNHLATAIDESEELLRKEAIKQGFNAIIGYRILAISHFDGFQGTVINDRRGVGYGYVRVMGTPVVIECSPPQKEAGAPKK